MRNPLASAVRIVLTTDPAIDRDALAARELDKMTEAEREDALKKLADHPHPLDAFRASLIEKALDEYTSTNRDPGKLIFKSGVTPAWGIVSPIRATYLDRLDNDEALDLRERLLRGLCAGVHKIIDADGTEYEATTTETNKQLVADDDWIETVKDVLGHSATHQLGAAALQLSRLPAKARPTSPSSAG